jgi:hypothetical protein
MMTNTNMNVFPNRVDLDSKWTSPLQEGTVSSITATNAPLTWPPTHGLTSELSMIVSPTRII